jgi:hypothetical protein
LAAPLDPLTEPGTPGAEALGQLATTDLELLHQLCGSLATNLSASAAGRERWVADLTKLGDQLKALPLAWRYDEVQLKRAHEDPNYEHLWFQFKNASFGSRFWPNFEFRLGAANVRPGQFTEHPKLEFPDPGPGQPKQFENWFAESEDQYGPKLELRFETRRRIFDIDVWNALSAEDQRQCLVLLAATSNLLPLMQARGHELSRPWQDWQSLVANQLVILVQASQAETA